MSENKKKNTDRKECSGEEIESGKSTAIIAHITIIGLIAAFIMNNDKKNAYGAYHIRQVLGLCLTGLALGIIGIIPVLGWIISILGSILLIVMWITGLIHAVNGKTKPMPVLGTQYMKWFKGL